MRLKKSLGTELVATSHGRAPRGGVCSVRTRRRTCLRTIYQVYFLNKARSGIYEVSISYTYSQPMVELESGYQTPPVSGVT